MYKEPEFCHGPGNVGFHKLQQFLECTNIYSKILKTRSGVCVGQLRYQRVVGSKSLSVAYVSVSYTHLTLPTILRV